MENSITREAKILRHSALHLNLPAYSFWYKHNKIYRTSRRFFRREGNAKDALKTIGRLKFLNPPRFNSARPIKNLTLTVPLVQLVNILNRKTSFKISSVCPDRCDNNYNKSDMSKPLQKQIPA